MPCGGIEPFDGGPGTIYEKIGAAKGGCWVCQRGGCKHFYHEFDTYIHASCALDEEFLDQEGSCIIEHQHTMILDFSLEEKGLGFEIVTDIISKLSPEQTRTLIQKLQKQVDKS